MRVEHIACLNNAAAAACIEMKQGNTAWDSIWYLFQQVVSCEWSLLALLPEKIIMVHVFNILTYQKINPVHYSQRFFQ